MNDRRDDAKDCERHEKRGERAERDAAAKRESLQVTMEVWALHREPVDIMARDVRSVETTSCSPMWRVLIAEVMRESLQLGVVGALVGVAAAFAVSELLATQLVGVKPHDPVSFGASVAALILAVAMYPPRYLR